MCPSPALVAGTRATGPTGRKQALRLRARGSWGGSRNCLSRPGPCRLGARNVQQQILVQHTRADHQRRFEHAPRSRRTPPALGRVECRRRFRRRSRRPTRPAAARPCRMTRPSLLGWSRRPSDGAVADRGRCAAAVPDRPRRHRALDGPGRGGGHASAARGGPGRRGRDLSRRRRGRCADQFRGGAVPCALQHPPGPAARAAHRPRLSRRTVDQPPESPRRPSHPQSPVPPCSPSPPVSPRWRTDHETLGSLLGSLRKWPLDTEDWAHPRLCARYVSSRIKGYGAARPRSGAGGRRPRTPRPGRAAGPCASWCAGPPSGR